MSYGVCYESILEKIIAVNALGIGPQSSSDKNWERLTSFPYLSMLNYGEISVGLTRLIPKALTVIVS